MKTLIQDKSEILRQFAKRVSNAQSMSIDYGRDKLSVWVDNIHAVEFKASNILNNYETLAKSKGFAIQWSNKR